MISVHLLTKEQVAKALLDLGCAELESPFEEHSAWVTAWDLAFFVPQLGPDLMTAEIKLNAIIDEILTSKPKMH